MVSFIQDCLDLCLLISWFKNYKYFNVPSFLPKQLLAHAFIHSLAGTLDCCNSE